MPGSTFGSGDTCWLSAHYQNPGAAQTVDFYCLLDVLGSFWAYPSWQSINESGLDFVTWEIPAGADTAQMLIPEFTMPEVSPAGPFYFYAAMFETGYLDLDHLASSGGMWEFSLE
jgi:hypothetical protein